ncbi:hypothetical protein ACGFZ7_20130 [Pseudomonas sp. NPDC047963]|nr:hypothetical protein [Pseudomonas sp.]MDX2351394.1 hypothetical protein [Stutzerimonas xanthomarina]
MQTCTLGPQGLVVGGSTGMRYIITGSSIVEHGSSAGPLLSDRYSAIAVSPSQLQSKDAT